MHNCTAGYTDNNNDGLLGNVAVTQNASGTVTSGVDGYTLPISESPSTTLDFRNSAWDVKCFNPQINVEKTAVVSDVNNSSTTDLGDIITYTITVSNTGLTSVTLTDYDTLSAEDGTFIATLTLNFTSTASTTTLSVTRNYIEYSSRIDEVDYDWDEAPGSYGQGWCCQDYIPAGVSYYMNNASGRTAAQVGLSDGYNYTPGNFGDNTSHNYNDVEAGRIRRSSNDTDTNRQKYHNDEQYSSLIFL